MVLKLLIPKSISQNTSSMYCVTIFKLKIMASSPSRNPAYMYFEEIGKKKKPHLYHQNSLSEFNYRLIIAYLLLRVYLDKIMHVHQDFDASSARTRRVSALDQHQNGSASASFCLNSRAQSKYAVVNLIHIHDVNKLFFLLLCDK